MKKNKKLITVFVVVIIILLLLIGFFSFGDKTKILEKYNFPKDLIEQLKNNENSDDIAVQNDAISTQAINTSNWDLEKVDIVYDTANVAVPVPKGYVASSVTGEHTVKTGFVIYEGTKAVTNSNAWNESCNRNQWVWVPVPDASRIYEIDSNGRKKSKLYDYSSTGRTKRINNEVEPGVSYLEDFEDNFGNSQLQGMTQDKLLKEIQNEFDDTINSIETYGGFWIGRYETGNSETKLPVTKRMTKIDYTSNWYMAYKNIQRMGTGENVKTSMLFGCLWDETLQWFIDTGSKKYEDMINSSSWGVYDGTTFDYKKADGTTVTKKANQSITVPTGSTEYSKNNNIYDMAGNNEDGTLEAIGYYKVIRGGNFYFDGSSLDKYPVSCRDYEDLSVEMLSNTAFRAFLYIK